MPKKSESADIEEPKLENEGTIEEELNVNISPTPADMKSPTSRTTKVGFTKISIKRTEPGFPCGSYDLSSLLVVNWSTV